MSLRRKQVIITGAAVWLISIVFVTSGVNLTKRSSNPSFARPTQTAWSSAPFFAGMALAQGQAAAAARPQMSEEAFKNIQVLKGIPVDEFMGTMGLFSAALSVCCGDCHTGAGTSNPKWDADPPRKAVARRMVLMVNAINRDNFNGRNVVTCWTCHRGAQSPAATPPLVHQREGDLARVYDGRNAWVMLPLTVVGLYPLNGSALEGGKLDAEMAFPGGIKGFFNTRRVSFPSNLDGRDVYVVQGLQGT